jgi:hypothetical protein
MKHIHPVSKDVSIILIRTLVSYIPDIFQWDIHIETFHAVLTIHKLEFQHIRLKHYDIECLGELIMIENLVDKVDLDRVRIEMDIYYDSLEF